ncbi:vWA domain-containing protein [Desulfopila aestuarii]|uniref:Ca-activated chloride channel family protein n=1 Tax=Desulfopila aestuarii DSM 18488 TaxID=1121416 RepID=A0A1M7XVX9_9BACT|nr:VWA domain-containing protein [Desulfopila aestuarii]SHO42857.1 Ca-activated chloride channel family protein [Desulfopila aestuarii DSM 18488]
MSRPNATCLIALATALTFFSGCTDTRQPTDQTTISTTPAYVEKRKKEEPQPPPTTRLAVQESSVSAPSQPVAKAGRYEERDADFVACSVDMALPATAPNVMADYTRPQPIQLNSESYTPVRENTFINASNDPLSTFSIDVDTASYANIRRFINEGSLPPTGAVRIEEMINYFTYNYPEPESGPFNLIAEAGPAPWHSGHQLVKIGLKAKSMQQEAMVPSNLVFLIDVSGSMQDQNKLPLLQQSMLLLADQLTARDRLSIVVYAGNDSVVLLPTSGDKKEEIRKAISQLTSGGSTHASSGIQTAYALAGQTFMPSGNNRVILASDGDFNVGVTDRGDLQQLITEKRKTGVFLTVLGFGMGNYHDDTMEILADSGNGNYAYIDSLLEAKKVLIKERASTLFTLASDVKIQVEFNPALVGAYRLIGYENRVLADEDFKDDSKDAGEIGLGHTVTALYEIIPPGGAGIPDVDGLKYRMPAQSTSHKGELMTVKLRYKPKGQETSVAQELAVTNGVKALYQTSDDFRFAASVAGFGMYLKQSNHIKDLQYAELLKLARNSRGQDDDGYRAEFIRLLEMAELISH